MSSQAATHERQRDRYDPAMRAVARMRLAAGWRHEREPAAVEDTPARRTGKELELRARRTAPPAGAIPARTLPRRRVSADRPFPRNHLSRA